MKHAVAAILIVILLLFFAACIFSFSSYGKLCYYCYQLIFSDPVRVQENNEIKYYHFDCYEEYDAESNDEAFNSVPQSNLGISLPLSDVGISVSQMEYGSPYLLIDGKIHPIEQVDKYLNYLAYSQIQDILPVSEPSQIIMRAYDDRISSISITEINISTDNIVNPFVRFYYHKTSGKLKFSYPDLNLHEDYEVDNIDGEYEYEYMPLLHAPDIYHEDDYYLCSQDTSMVYWVGYWRGTEYKEVVIDASHAIVKELGDSIHCGFTKTRDGYAILDLPDLDAGYYYLRGFAPGGYVICIE